MKATFREDWLKAIAHLSRRMQDRIIADVTRWQLTGEVPEKMSAMRRALFNTFILQIDPNAKLEQPEPVGTRNLAPTPTPSKTPAPPKESKKPEKPKKPAAPKSAAEYPDYMIPITEMMIDRFLGDREGYGVLVNFDTPEFTVPLSEVRRVAGEWQQEGRRYLTYRDFRDKLVYEFHKDQIDRYRREHPVPIPRW